MVSLDDATAPIMQAQSIEDKGLNLIVLSYDTIYHAKTLILNLDRWSFCPQQLQITEIPSWILKSEDIDRRITHLYLTKHLH